MLDVLSVPILLAVALMTGAQSVVLDATWSASIPALAGRRDLADANGKLMSSVSLAQVTGPVLAGTLIALLTGPITRRRAGERVPILPEETRRGSGGSLASFT